MLSNPETEIKEEVGNLYVKYKRMPWEKICLSILKLLPMGKFASALFIYNKMIEWHFLNSIHIEKHIKAISGALHNLNAKRLIVKEDIRIEIIGRRKFIRFCKNNKEGEIVELPLRSRSYSAFRIPVQGEKITIPPEKMRKILRQASKKKIG